MSGGFRAAEAFVEVTARVNERAVTDSARRAAEQVDHTMVQGAERTGETLSDTLSGAGERAGKSFADKADGRLRDSRGRFTRSGTDIGADIGVSAAGGFGASLVKNMPEALGPAAAPVALLLAPTIGALLSAAVVGGAGIGGVIGGVTLAARDPRVKAAGSELGKFVSSDLETRAAGFVPRVLDGIGEIKHSFVAMGPDLDRIFRSSRFVDPLVDGVTKGASQLVHGIADAIDKADPVIDSFGRMFDAVGGSLGGFFTTVSGRAKEGASAMDDFTGSLTSAIDTAGMIVDNAAAVKGWTDNVDTAIDKGRYWIEGLSMFGGELDLTADGFTAGTNEAEAYQRATTGVASTTDFATLKLAGMSDAAIAAADSSGTFRQKIGEVNAEAGIVVPTLLEVSDRTRIMNQSMAEAVTGTGSLANAFNVLNGGVLNARQAESNYQAAIVGVTASVKEHGKGLNKSKTDFDLHTAAGRANDAAMRTLVGTINQKAQAAYDETAATKGTAAAEQAAKGVYEQGRQQLVKNLTQILGNAGAAKALADKIMGIPKSWGTEVTLTDMATAKAKAIKHEISTINGKTVVIDVKYETHGSAQGEHIIGQGTQLRAAGGEIMGGSGFRDDVPVLAMGGEWMIKKRARIALERTFGKGIMDRLNNWDTGRAPSRPDRIDPAISAIGGINRAAPAPTRSAPSPSGPTFGPGAVSINVDVSALQSVHDLIRMLDRLRQSARSAYGAGVTA